MDFSHFVSSPLFYFLALVAVDTLLGVGLALKNKVFDHTKLPDFIGSQLGTKEALVVAGLVVTAAVSSASASVSSSGIVDLSTVATMAYVAANGAAAVMSLSLLGDIKDKVLNVFGSGSASSSAMK